jgi:chromosome segregation protein
VQIQHYTERQPALEDNKEQLQQKLMQSRETSMLAHRKFDEVTVRLESWQNELNVLTQSFDQGQQQINHLVSKQADLEQRLSANDSPVEAIKIKLQETLSDRLTLESQLTQVRDRFDAHEKQSSILKAKLQDVMSQQGNTQAEIQEIRLNVQRMTVEQEHLVADVQKLDHDVKVIIEQLSDDMDENALSGQLEKTQQHISRLGPINLAAISEHEEVSKRCDYLEKQKEDLLKALELLKEAIRKVDKETKERFKQTFDAVNENFSTLFPRIFEGGYARLELTDDDLLKAGVIVKAQPPGKRNTSIHLKEMSGKTQFLIITHNKVTMEMADALMGVTMQEAGVSRVVSVTMEDAIQYAQSAENAVGST